MKSKSTRQRVDPKRWSGVYYYESDSKRFRGKPDVCYYVNYKVDGKKRWEKVGWKSEGYTPQVASEIRAERVKAARHGETVKTAKEIRIEQRRNDVTLGELSDSYFDAKGGSLKGLKTDKNRWELHLKPVVGGMPVTKLSSLTIARITRDMRSKEKADATIWNTLELLRRVINFGAKSNMCPPLTFTIEMPQRDNEVVEFLTPEEANRLIEVLDTWPTEEAPRMVKLAMFTGMRRGEIFKLQNNDLDFRNGLVTLRKPKGKKTVSIPMNRITRGILQAQIEFRDMHYPGSEFIFPGRDGTQRTDCSAVDRIKKEAELPKRFRIFHGLRHHFAVTLANSGQVTLDMISELLTHKSLAMTRRYAQFMPNTIKEAGNKAADLLEEHMNSASEGDEGLSNVL